jgi:RHS repeat-associated protein
LSSTRLITDSRGVVVGGYDYKAFGEQVSRGGGASTDIRFTGQRTATGTGLSSYADLIFFKSRFYDPTLARFISADSVIADKNKLTGLDQYAFVFNNPISNVDPTGHAPDGADGSTFDKDPVAGYNQVPLMPSDESEWAPYKPASAVTLPGASDPPLLTAQGAQVCCATNFGEYQDILWRLAYETAPDTQRNRKLELQQSGFQAIWDKNSVATEGSLVILSLGEGALFVGPEALAAQTLRYEQNAALLARARDARNALALELQSEAPAAVTAGYNIRTGQVVAQASACGLCAEAHVVELLGGVRSEIRLTEAIRPRNMSEVQVCPVCEAAYGRGSFPPGTFFGRGPTGGTPP